MIFSMSDSSVRAACGCAGASGCCAGDAQTSSGEAGFSASVPPAGLLGRGAAFKSLGDQPEIVFEQGDARARLESNPDRDTRDDQGNEIHGYFSRRKGAARPRRNRPARVLVARSVNLVQK